MNVHTIKNSKLSVSVNSLGAELCSVKNADNFEYIWQGDKSVWARHAPVLFPIVGRLKNDKYTYDRQTYSLSQHGFARDKIFILLEHTENCLEFELTPDEEMFLNYPFHFSLRIRYELNDSSLKIKYIVFNPDNTVLPFSIGAHPGFNCSNLSDFYLEFKNTRDLVAQKLQEGLIGDETYIIKLDQRRLKLSPELFVNDALVFKNMQVDELTLCSERSTHKIKMTCTNWPYFGIWSKKGCDNFVCLEPWFGIADGLNSNGNILLKEGIIKLGSYKTFEEEFCLMFS